METALENVNEGQRNLAKAARLKTALYPVAGAFIGTCIGGPIGLLAGLKIGGLAAIGGSLLGFAGGSGLKKMQETATTESVQDMTKSKSTPCILKDVGESESLAHSKSFQ